MIFGITDEIFSQYPDLRVGVVVGHGLDIRPGHPLLPEHIERLRRSLSERVGDRPLSEFPNIAAWRETYRSFGVNPRKFTPTAEALLSRLLKNKPFPNINTAVDAYLLVEMETMLPIGGYDLRKLSGDVTLRRSPGGEAFEPLGSGGAVETTTGNEMVYADHLRVLTRNWNYRDAETTKISEETTDIVLACEAALGAIDTVDIEATVKGIVAYESMFCGGRYRTWILDSSHREITID